MARTYCPFLYDYLEEMADLSDAEFGRLARALIKYSATGEPIALSGNERHHARRVMLQEDKFQKNEKSEELREKRKAAGKLGAARRWGTDGKMANDSKNGNIESESELELTLPSNDGELARARASGFSDELISALEEWLTYKAEKRQNYKPTGLKALVSEIKNNADKYGDEAVAALIRECMASNWQGIVFDRLSMGGKHGKRIDGNAVGLARQKAERDWGIVYTVDGTQGSDAQQR